MWEIKIQKGHSCTKSCTKSWKTNIRWGLPGETEDDQGKDRSVDGHCLNREKDLAKNTAVYPVSFDFNWDLQGNTYDSYWQVCNGKIHQEPVGEGLHPPFLGNDEDHNDIANEVNEKENNKESNHNLHWDVVTKCHLIVVVAMVFSQVWAVCHDDGVVDCGEEFNRIIHFPVGTVFVCISFGSAAWSFNIRRNRGEMRLVFLNQIEKFRYIIM